MLSELFMVLGTLLPRWLIKNTPIYSIGLSHLIGTPKNKSKMNYKINTMLYATDTRMQNPLWRLTIFMLQFVIGGCHLELLWKHVSMSLQIGLTFGIFVLGNGEVSWSM
jgi:hypothetical protein